MILAIHQTNSAPLSCNLHKGYNAEEMKNIGKITKFIVPAKFSNCLIYTDINKPKAPSIIPNKIVAGRMYSHPKTGVEKFTNRLIIGIQIIKKT